MISIADEVAKHQFTGWQPADEGRLEPACTCGWRGPWEPWTAKLAKDDRPDDYFRQHRLRVELDAATHAYSAEMAAAALTQAAAAWTGDEDFARWLQARADHITGVGLYDGRTWPGEPQVDAQ